MIVCCGCLGFLIIVIIILCVDVPKKINAMVNENVGFGGFNVFFALVILSELIIKCVIRFARLVRILEKQH